MRDGKRISVCALLILSASVAHAADRGFYFGASGGQAKYDFNLSAPVAVFIPGGGFTSGDPQPIPPDFTPLPPFNAGSAFVAARPALWGLPGDDDEATAWSLTAGYRANRYLAFEVSYVNLGTLESTLSTDLPPVLGGGVLTVHRQLETTGPALTAFGILPVSDSWELYVRAGVLFADSELTTAVNGGSANSTTYGSEANTVGGGAQFDWGGHWSARLEYLRLLDVGGDDVASDADVDGLSLAVLYRL